MKEILLSADSKMAIYLVPDDVANHLEKYCLEFACNWIWKNPNGTKLLKKINGQMIAYYDANDFIDYLNEWIFPTQTSTLVKQLDFDDYEIPQEYKEYPKFNF